MNEPDTRYVKTDDGVYIAYQTVGEGPIDIAWQFEWMGNVDVIWRSQVFAEWFGGLASFSRLILHDRRGTGASSRNVAPPNLETRVADLRAVLDAAGSARPVLGAQLEGGAASVMFAATMPERVHSLFWWYPAPRSEEAPDYPWGMDAARLAAEMDDIAGTWGTKGFEEGAAAEAAGIPYGLLSRQTATPDVAIELENIWRETDVRGTLPAVTAPTLLLARDQDRDALEYIASLMPHARVQLFPGAPPFTNLPAIDEQAAVLAAIRTFIGVETPAPELDTILSTVLFTDIVGSTKIQAALGDRGWKALVESHHAIVRDALTRWRGMENDTAGDGFYATFDGPARAIRCAQEVSERVRDLEIEIRAGIHTGECELIDNKCGGLTVSIGARVASNAGPSEVLVSQTVKDLTAGSGLTFEDAGEHELKGIPDRWHLYRVVGTPKT
jgi:class 3 adenylate cyclase